MKQQNILFIMTDQMHKYALGCVSEYVKTPNLDRLAAEGTLFTSSYSNNPLCTPFRGILYSGRYSSDTGTAGLESALRQEEICLPDELGELGYETSFVGKLHLGGKGNCPVPKAFWAGHKHFFGYQCYNGFEKDVCFYDEEGKEHCFQGHRTDVTADLGIERLRWLASTGKPFLHTIFFQAPHYPVQPSEKYAHLYDDITIPMPEEYQGIEPYTETYSPRSAQPRELCPDYQKYGGDIQKYLKLYYGMVSQIDANVGRILEELEQLEIADHTTIIFSSDHGDMQGSHGLKNKILPYERSCGIPLIIKIPGMNQVPRVTVPVSAVDYYPTCMELAGRRSRKDLRGESLLPLIQGASFEHGPVFAESHGSQEGTHWYMLRTDRWKLVINSESRKPSLLFDMENDPDESRNLVENLEYEEVREELYSKLLQIIDSIK